VTRLSPKPLSAKSVFPPFSFERLVPPLFGPIPTVKSLSMTKIFPHARRVHGTPPHLPLPIVYGPTSKRSKGGASFRAFSPPSLLLEPGTRGALSPPIQYEFSRAFFHPVVISWASKFAFDRAQSPVLSSFPLT